MRKSHSLRRSADLSLGGARPPTKAVCVPPEAVVERGSRRWRALLVGMLVKGFLRREKEEI